MDINNEIEHLQALIREHRKRLQVLELRAAREGLHSPPAIINEINDLQQQIAALEEQLRELIGRAPVAHMQHGGWTLDDERQLGDIQRFISEVWQAFPQERQEPAAREEFGPLLLKELLLYFLLLKTYPQSPREPPAANLRCFDQSTIKNQIRYERQSAHVIELSGPGGIGKTHVLQALQREEDRNRPDVGEIRERWRYIYVRGVGGFDDIMAAFIRELAPDSTPSGALTHVLAQCLFGLHREGFSHILFILDDADAIDDDTLLRLADDEGPVGRGVEERLSGVALTLRLVVVMRRPRFMRALMKRPDIRIHTLQMDALDLESVRDMLHERLPHGLQASKTVDMAEIIYEITGGHPGAIEIVLRTPEHELFTLLPSEYYSRFRPIVLNIIHRDIIGNLRLNEYLLLNILSIFRRLHVGIIWDLLEMRLLPSNLLGAASDERAMRRWLEELAASSALIRRDHKSSLFPFGVHPVLQRVLPLSLAAHRPDYLRQLHVLAHQMYHHRLCALDATDITLALSFSLRAFYTMEALYHFVQIGLVEPQASSAATTAQELVALAEEYWRLFGDSYRAEPPGSGRDDRALLDQWMQDTELRKLVGRLADGAAIIGQIQELFERDV